jgi:hypothetical protein
MLIAVVNDDDGTSLASERNSPTLAARGGIRICWRRTRQRDGGHTASRLHRRVRQFAEVEPPHIPGGVTRTNCRGDRTMPGLITTEASAMPTSEFASPVWPHRPIRLLWQFFFLSFFVLFKLQCCFSSFFFFGFFFFSSFFDFLVIVYALPPCYPRKRDDGRGDRWHQISGVRPGGKQTTYLILLC